MQERVRAEVKLRDVQDQHRNRVHDRRRHRAERCPRRELLPRLGLEAEEAVERQERRTDVVDEVRAVEQHLAVAVRRAEHEDHDEEGHEQTAARHVAKHQEQRRNRHLLFPALPVIPHQKGRDEAARLALEDDRQHHERKQRTHDEAEQVRILGVVDQHAEAVLRVGVVRVDHLEHHQHDM